MLFEEGDLWIKQPPIGNKKPTGGIINGLDPQLASTQLTISFSISRHPIRRA